MVLNGHQKRLLYFEKMTLNLRIYLNLSLRFVACKERWMFTRTFMCDLMGSRKHRSMIWNHFYKRKWSFDNSQHIDHSCCLFFCCSTFSDGHTFRISYVYWKKALCYSRKPLRIHCSLSLFGNLLQFLCFQLSRLQIIPFIFNQTNPHKLINSLKVS